LVTLGIAADSRGVDATDLVLVRGLRDTRATFAAWNRAPGRVLGGWLALSLAIAVGLLGATWAVASLSRPDLSPFVLPGLQVPARLGDALHVLARNALVLALHGFACVAGFIARSSLPLEAERHTGAWRWVHDRAGGLAVGFVGLATVFSLSTQAYVIGGQASTLAHELGISPGLLIVGLLPHALPELTALFLPLAAWLLASRHGRWNELLAATFVTCGLAAPVLVVCSLVEVYVSPRLVAALAS
jgi:stage II sporulation SpoM-like protein